MKRNPPGYWTKKRCREAALKCETRREFQKNCGSACNASKKNGWYEEIASHLKLKQHPKNYWTKERCINFALEHETIIELRKSNATVYKTIHQNKWTKEAFSHMKYIGRGHFEKRKVYKLIWPKQKCIYIGISNNPKRRISEHFRKGGSSKMKACFLNYGNPEVHVDLIWMDYIDAAKYEDRLINRYKKGKWNVVNSVRGGALGGNKLNWTKDKCRKEALKYRTYSEFIENSNGAYCAARRKGWGDYVCSHLVSTRSKMNR